jgi:hypothetical protein
MAFKSDIPAPGSKAVAITRAHGNGHVELVTLIVISPDHKGSIVIDGSQLGGVFPTELEAVQAAIDAMNGANVKHIRFEEIH